ncbi:hypothetical protein PFICI_05929 [Pestalotiopsis fici W106-1]|uniref:CBS domain-containing protein n=1 Tax=Pestalotiopsis fici (strain W106-1 / CGMCC3.15140) TaxID=1229662 RepID=W3XD78_PESFW|nr:uncharacterized protein PFICI_05929 [Pestalotiopsis fici W106-1]ETS84053.1 hypothetical protein PFICI_05929 [Pestalotiopsis fici W106-1]
MDESTGSAGSAIDTSKDAPVPSPAPPSRSNSSSSLHRIPSHRQSFAENLRGMPPSPRSQRHPSFTQAAIQDLLNHPPTTRPQNPRFAGRDWRHVHIGELISRDDVKWVDMDTSVEDASMVCLMSLMRCNDFGGMMHSLTATLQVLLKSASNNVVLIREHGSDGTVVSTFDHNDLNAYLLVVVGLAHPTDDLVALYDSIAKKAQANESIPLRDIQPICRKEALVILPANEDLAKAIEVFGSGIHRVLVTNAGGDVVGVLSQLRLVEFFWNEGVNFRVIDDLYPRLMRDLGIGSQQVIAVSAESPLADALSLMSEEGLSSLAVIDSNRNVVGNISTVDVRLLTNAASLPLLQNTCMHFISVILNERGVEKGKDSFPVFHVNPHSSLAHTVGGDKKPSHVGSRVCFTFTISASNAVAWANSISSQLHVKLPVPIGYRCTFSNSASIEYGGSTSFGPLNGRCNVDGYS